MNEYQVTARAVTIREGRVQMTDEQARRRRHHTRPVKGEAGIYEVISPFQFKHGETFGYDGEVSKSLMADVTTVGDVPPNARPEDPADLQSAIVAAIRGLDEDNPDNFTGGGKPQVPALMLALGYTISAKERDAAWAEASKTPAATMDEERMAAIQEAIGALDADADGHFDEDGMPNPAVVNDLLDFEATDEEVAAAAELLADVDG